jgi:hypothetical protein
MATVEQTVALAVSEVIDVLQRLMNQRWVARTFSSTRVPAVFSGLGTARDSFLGPRAIARSCGTRMGRRVDLRVSNCCFLVEII